MSTRATATLAAALTAIGAVWGAPVRASTPARGAAGGSALMQAFVLAGAPDSLADLEAHPSAIGTIYPTYYECEPTTGAIAGEGDAGGGAGAGGDGGAEATAITAYARARHIAVMPRFNCQDGPTVHTILTEPRARARTLAGLESIASNPSYAGVNLDLENDVPADRDALTSFAGALARELHARAKKLSVDVDGVTHDNPAISTGLYDDRALAAVADYVFVIAWGTHWAGSAPGPIAPLSYVSAVARYLAALPHANRFVLGAPMYGLDWPVARGSSPQPPATALQYANVLTLAHATGASPVLDRAVDEPTFAYARAGVSHRVWYMDAQSVADRLRIAREHGLLAGVWRLGGEDQALWSSPAVVEGAHG
jgi:spore germination protein YaaH